MGSKALEFAIRKLAECKLFVEEVGDEEFIRQRARQNITKIEIEKQPEADGSDGYYNFERRTVVVRGYDDVQEFEQEFERKKQNNAQTTMVHETIHAILANFIKRGMITSSTGIMEYYKNGEECGRGLNEALTEWIVEKTGLSSTSYKMELSLLKQIELAIGEKAVMRMANGNIANNIANILKMTKIECIKFLNQIDNIHFLKRDASELTRIIKLLEEKKTKLDIDPKRVAKIDEILKGKDSYTLAIESNDYIVYLSENSLADTIETRIDYLKSLEKKHNASLELGIAEVETEIYNVYFKEELERLSSQTEFSYEEAKRYIEKYDNYMSLIMTTNIDAIEGVKPEYSDLRRNLLNMQLRYNRNLRTKFIKVIREKTIEQMQNGELAAAELSENIKLIIAEDKRQRETNRMLFENGLIDKDEMENTEVRNIAAKMVPGNPDGMVDILENKSNVREDSNQKSATEIIQELEEVITIGTNDKKRVIYTLNDGTVGILRNDTLVAEGTELTASDEEIENREQLFDFTLEMDGSQDMNIIIRNFEALKQEIEARMPGAEIRILNEVIYVKGEKGEEFYINEGNDWVQLKDIQRGTMQYREPKAKEEKQINQKVSFHTIMSAIGKMIIDTFNFKKNRRKALQLPSVTVRKKEETFSEKLKPENYENIEISEINNQNFMQTQEKNNDGR